MTAMTKRKSARERVWYPLDGTWHASVHHKQSALHISMPDDSALCNPTKTILYTDSGYTEAEAKLVGRTLCKRCYRAARPDEKGGRG